MAISPVLMLVGPTAIGKTALSLQIADEFDCEIISMDSMQVYRYMDIGTAKATREEQQRVRHHLIDIVDPDEQYNAARFMADTLAAVEGISSRGKIPLITGGTGLYLSSLNNTLFKEPHVKNEIRARLKNRLAEEGREVLFAELQQHDAQTAARVHGHDTQRILRGLEIFLSTGITWSEHIRQQHLTCHKPLFPRQLQLCLSCEREELYRRINLRTQMIMQAPFHNEVVGLLNKGYDGSLASMQSLGYRHMVNHLRGEWSLSEATELLARDTRHFAKRQLTWFRSRKELYQIERTEIDFILKLIDEFLRSQGHKTSFTA